MGSIVVQSIVLLACADVDCGPDHIEAAGECFPLKRNADASTIEGDSASERDNSRISAGSDRAVAGPSSSGCDCATVDCMDSGVPRTNPAGCDMVICQVDSSRSRCHANPGCEEACGVTQPEGTPTRPIGFRPAATEAATPRSGDSGACVPTQCEDNMCSTLADGCGGTLNCGSCRGTLKCGFKKPNECGTDSLCPVGHLCARVTSNSKLPDYEPKGAVIIFHHDEWNGAAPLPQPVSTEVARSGVRKLSENRWEIDVDVSDWTAQGNGYISVALSMDPSDELKARDLVGVSKGYYSVRTGSTYDLGTLQGFFLSPRADSLETPGHEAAGFIECFGECPFTCCVSAQPPSRSCRLECPSEQNDMVLYCDGPEDCTGTQVCCSTSTFGAERRDTFACTNADCRHDPSRYRHQRCHVREHCPPGEECMLGACQAAGSLNYSELPIDGS